MVGLLLLSDFIGRPGRDRIDFDVTATTDITLCCFQRQPFERLLDETPHVSQRLIRGRGVACQARAFSVMVIAAAIFIVVLRDTDRPARIDTAQGGTGIERMIATAFRGCGLSRQKGHNQSRLCRGGPCDPEYAGIDMSRLNTDGKVVVHRDVLQELPGISVNPNGMS